jgi:hypothetical protein
MGPGLEGWQKQIRPFPVFQQSVPNSQPRPIHAQARYAFLPLADQRRWVNLKRKHGD